MKKKKHRHKWVWIVSGYARRCIICNKREHFAQKMLKDKNIQILQGGFPIR